MSVKIFDTHALQTDVLFNTNNRTKLEEEDKNQQPPLSFHPDALRQQGGGLLACASHSCRACSLVVCCVLCVVCCVLCVVCCVLCVVCCVVVCCVLCVVCCVLCVVCCVLCVVCCVLCVCVLWCGARKT